MYSLRYFPEGNFDLLMQITSILYDTYQYPKLEFDKPRYLQRIAMSHAESPMIMCFDEDNVAIGGVTLSEEMFDDHFSGVGRHITTCVLVPWCDSKKALRLLIRSVQELVAAEGGTWYTYTNRRDMYTLSTRYRRIIDE